MSRLALGIPLASLVFAVVGCQVDRSAVSPDPQMVAARPPAFSVRGGQQPRMQRTLDDEYADMSGEVPGFAGMYEDASGQMVILLQDTTRLEQARKRVQRHLERSSRRDASSTERARKQLGAARVKRVRHDYRTLLAWRRTHVEKELERVGGASLVAIDQRNNRIVVGASDPAALGKLRLAMSKLPVPRSAIEVIAFRIDETKGSEHLRNPRWHTMSEFTNTYFSQAPGGVRITNGTAECTLGFNLVRWLDASTMDTASYFVTNGHCSAQHGSVGGQVGHPDVNGSSGNEVLDPEPLTSAQTSQCPSGRQCRLADASLYRWTFGSAAQHGFVANSAVGSQSVSGRRRVVQTTIPWEGQHLSKFGTNGRHDGTVLYPCARVDFATGPKTYFCQTVATYFSADGDSGGPVLQLLSDGVDAYAVGITFAFGGTYIGSCSFWNCQWQEVSVLSPIDAVLGYFYEHSGWLLDPTTSGQAPSPPTPPEIPSYWANVSGTSLAEPGASCEFFSGTNMPDPAYEWWVDGQLIGTGPSVSVSRTSSYELQLRVSNEIEGVATWASTSVTVEEGAGECFAQ